VSAAWVALTAGLLLLLFIITFIWQNRQNARLNFLWLHGNVPVGLTILLSFVVGGLLVGVLGALRLTQLRHGAGRRGHGERHRPGPPGRHPAGPAGP
jgi:uncharacterized integral membrane protein